MVQARAAHPRVRRANAELAFKVPETEFHSFAGVARGPHRRRGNQSGAPRIVASRCELPLVAAVTELLSALIGVVTKLARPTANLEAIAQMYSAGLDVEPVGGPPRTITCNDSEMREHHQIVDEGGYRQEDEEAAC